jgi:negative regulator of sigma E activity
MKNSGIDMMNEQKEQLSAIMDDFHASDDEQKVIDELLSDVNQRITLSRYQLIGDTLRNEIPERIKPGFAADVMSHIAQEPSLNVPVQKQQTGLSATAGLWSWLFKPVAGLAVAAAVAVVTISIFQTTPQIDNQVDQLAKAEAEANQARVEMLAQIPVIQNNAQRVSTNAPVRKLVNGMNWKIKRNEPAMQNKLNIYLINHNEYSNSMSGIIPQARVVGFDDQK